MDEIKLRKKPVLAKLVKPLSTTNENNQLEIWRPELSEHGVFIPPTDNGVSILVPWHNIEYVVFESLEKVKE